MTDQRILGSTRLPAHRRTLLAGAGAAAIAGGLPMRIAFGQQAKVKLGLMLPYSGTFAGLGTNITER